MNDRVRVVITGMGVISPLGGDSVEVYWQGLKEGKSGISSMTLVDTSAFPCKVAGEVKEFDPAKYINPREARRMGRFTQMAVAAAQLAAENARLNLSQENPERLGVLLGNGNGDFITTQENAKVLFEKGGMRVSPFFVSMILPNMAAATVSRILGLRGYSNTVITACAAGTQAIGEAAEVIRRGGADVIFSGGTEAGICELALGGFCVMRALTSWPGDPTKASRPFDANRDGFVPGEGAGVLILESLEHAVRRNATILAEVVGYGVTSDAYHPVQPEETGDGAARAIRLALQDAGIRPDQLDYINAHGTSTPLNDAAETLAIKKALGEAAYRVPISSTKSMIGHLLGAAGAVEAIACVKTIQEGIIHPTINQETTDPACDLDYVPNVARRKDVRYVLSDSFGFGGQNACLVLKRFEE
ncbi:MAG: beta-ketoacyl-[acyl-carrier-protein] synthase II [Dehalococcoidia bacterium]|nr:beta-ketoacyl-[acyl-carrier-protein] synthase II [Dehalococcoidia bacterium]